jgi:short-subunit dehydrogenase
MELANKNIILTGASSGIGYALAKLLAKEKCNLVLLARRKHILDLLANELKIFGKKIITIECDVSKKESVIDACNQIKKSLGEIDIAILNAGLSFRMSAEDFDSHKGEQVFNANFMGIVYFLEQLLPDFIKKKSGMIVGVSSLADGRGYPRSAFYSASKAAATKLLESLRIELKKFNIKIIIVKPGFVKTPMTDKNEFLMPFLMNVEKAAGIILKGIKKEKRVIQFPLPIVLGSKFLELIPDFLYDYFMSKQLPAKRDGK